MPAQTLLAAGGTEFAAGRAYYAMFYLAEALLYERDLTFSKHSAVQAAFGREFAKTGDLDPKYHRWLLAASNTRLETDYAFEVSVTHEEVEILPDQARQFLEAVRDYLAEETTSHRKP